MSKSQKPAAPKVVEKPINLNNLVELLKDLNEQIGGMLWSSRQRTNKIALALYDEVVRLKDLVTNQASQLVTASEELAAANVIIANLTEKWEQSEARFSKVLAMATDEPKIVDDLSITDGALPIQEDSPAMETTPEEEVVDSGYIEIVEPDDDDDEDEDEPDSVSE